MGSGEGAVRAVLLDVGGVFFLPDPEHVVGACSRGGVEVDPATLPRAHYEGASCFHVDYEGELPWNELWEEYLDSYMAGMGVPRESRPEVKEHLEAEFATAALWCWEIPGALDGLRALAATGVKLGIVSNADGLIGERLREGEILQVGPGPGIEVATLIDSGAVGVNKPDPRIFQIALDALDLAADQVLYVGDMPGIDVVGARAAGIKPLLMDPFALHVDADYDRVASLAEVAALVT
ncbi:MAG: HAD-IA family hydrolase [Acidimicrobiia bacterium]